MDILKIKKRYRDIVKVPKEFFLTQIKPFAPSPTEDDYKVGYIRRNFVQKANDKNSIIYEISESSYIDYERNPLLIVCSLNWKISGTEKEIKEINQKVVKYASNRLPAIQLYLPNLLQFSKNNLGE